MADVERFQKNLESRGFLSSYFQTVKEAVDYLDGKLDGTAIGFGGSVTVLDIGLYDRLSTHNTTFWHWKNDTPVSAANASKVYISSVNGVAETGELINIDGVGNRTSATLFGPEKVYFIIGVNKISPDYDSALWRARNVAAPKNAQRLNRKTPCAVKADRCYDCKSPERICQALAVLWGKPSGIKEMEIVIINQDLGL